MQHIRATYEYARIPQIARGYKALGRFKVGLFDKAFDIGQPRSGGCNIAIGRRRLCRPDAQGYNALLLCPKNCLFDSIDESALLRHIMIGRHKDVHTIGIMGQRPSRRRSHRRRRIAAFRFKQYLGRGPDSLELFDDKGAMHHPANHNNLAATFNQRQHT